VGHPFVASVLLADMSTASDSPRFGVVGFLSSASAEKGVKLLQRSPGPVYKPDDAWFGKGPHGIGPEYSMRASHRFPLNERNTKQVLFPGPKYMMPKGLGRQAESTKRSFNTGKFSNCPRHTMDPGPERSPGPAAYNREALGLVTVARAMEPNKKLTTGMGGATRFYERETRTGTVPGPGQYALPSAIGGKALPHKSAPPCFPFGKDGARHAHSIKDPAMVDPCSPGPAAKYKINAACGNQASSARPTSAQYGFGTSSRFPCSPEDNRSHLEALQRIKRRHEAIANRRAQSAGPSRPAAEAAEEE